MGWWMWFFWLNVSQQTQTVKFRRTLSAVGTGAGKRQAQGS
jgi:hypothetical protein